MQFRLAMTPALPAAAVLALVACSAGGGGVSTAVTPKSAAPVSSSTAAGTSVAAGGLPQSPAGAAGVDAANLITGTIASTAPGYITVNTQRGPLRLAVDDSVRANRVIAAARADLKVDENVAVTGERADDGAITAQSVSLSLNPPAGENATTGRTPDGGFLRNRAGASGQTGGVAGTPAPADQGRFAGGFGGGPLTADQADQLVQQAVANGRITQDQAAAFRARLLAGGGRDGTPVAGFRSDGTPAAGRFIGGRAFGRIVSIEGDRLVIDSNSGQVNVLITSTTTFQRVENVPPSELPVGTTVSVAAERGADGVVRATNVFVGGVGPAGFGFGGVPGQRQP